MRKLILVLIAGLPGTGKSTLAYKLAQETGWCLLSKDQINQSLKKEGIDSGRAGYEVLLDLADLNLQNSVSVILDASFSFERLRQRAENLAEQYSARFLGVECICNDEELLQKRFTKRPEMVRGWKPADWDEYKRVEEYWEAWSGSQLKLDATKPIEVNYKKLVEFIS